MLKRLKNLGFYYLLIGVAFAASFIFFEAWRIAILGVVLLLLWGLIRHVAKKEHWGDGLSKGFYLGFDVVTYLLPFLMLIAIFTYHYRPFKQALMVPDGYEGVITISYDDPDGQPIRVPGGASRYRRGIFN